MLLGVMWMMTALVVGFMVGRISMYGLWDNDESAEEAENDIVPTERRKKKWLRRGHFQEDQRQFWAVGSPVSGEVMGFEETPFFFEKNYSKLTKNANFRQLFFRLLLIFLKYPL